LRQVASRVWLNPPHLVLPERKKDGEERWHAIGRVGGATLLVVHSYPGGDETVIRIISARRATRHERRAYEEA
jgi:hypothetical protein